MSAGRRPLAFTTLADAERALYRLAQDGERRTGGTWTWAQVLVHAAQSIEFSMSGFPQAKSRGFQRTLGAAAFALFRARGRMSHPLGQAIPGAPALDAAADDALALARLLGAIDAFRRWDAPLQPHFAYGALARPDYERAHAMHLADHLSAFQ